MFCRILFLLGSLLKAESLLADDGVSSSVSFMQPLFMIGFASCFFYFILWRPEQQRRKAAEKRRNELAKGDKVIAMGIMGTVDQISEHTVTLHIASGKIEVLKTCVTEILKPDGTKL